MGEFRLGVFAFQRAQLRQAVAHAAVAADKLRAAALRFALGAAVRAFVEHAVETVGAERLVHDDAIFLLPAEVIKGKFIREQRVDLVRALLRGLPGREQIAQFRGDIDPAVLQPIVERVARERAAGTQQHDRHAERLDALAEALRQRRGRAVEAVARLGIEEDGAFELLHRVEHIAHERGVRLKLPRGNAAERAHQSRLAHKAVRRADDVEGARVEHRRSDLQVQKAGVIHQNETGLVRAEPLHTHAVTAKMRRAQVRRGQRAQERAEQHGRTARRRVLFSRLRERLLVGHIHDLDLHGGPPARGFMFPQQDTMNKAAMQSKIRRGRERGCGRAPRRPRCRRQCRTRPAQGCREWTPPRPDPCRATGSHSRSSRGP